MNKDFILNNIARLTAEQLYDAIKEGVVSLDELRATGRLIYDKQEKIRSLIVVEEEVIREEEKAWENAKSMDTVDAYQNYLSRYPNGNYSQNASNTILYKQQSRDDEKRELLVKIKNGEYLEDRIKEMLENRQITKDDLINAGVISREGLELFLNTPEFFDEQRDWADLPPLKPNKTDIYFFGIPASGKSCLLAGLLHYMHTNALLKLDVNNMIGRKYANALLSLINSSGTGYVPPSTVAEGINYIEAEIRSGLDEHHAMHPVNILEMSGELFITTYKNATTASTTNEGKKTIGANAYLYNENRKVIFLVIDYQETVSPLITQTMAKQALQLGTILDFLHVDGTLAKTDALHIVLTKSDLLPGGAGDLATAEQFIEKEYKNLRQSIKDYKAQHGFRDSRIIPFSLGKFMMGKIFDYNPTFSETIYKSITASTFTNPKPKGFSFFSRK